MIKRYSDQQLDFLWSDENKVAMWQEVELAVIEARTHLRQVTVEVYQKILFMICDMTVKKHI